MMLSNHINISTLDFFKWVISYISIFLSIYDESFQAGLGWFTQVMPRLLTYSISTALFALFGMKMLYDGYRMTPADGQENYAEAKTEIQKKELLLDSSKVSDVESGGITATNQK